MFEKAKVIRLHKLGIFVDPNNFRPISILPTISILFEIMLFAQISSFLDKNVLSQKQYGFGFGRKISTISALVMLTSEIQKSLGNEESSKKQIFGFRAPGT